ncbi:YqeG family HAD IIIA-type phosphatase [Hydrogenoanaerobacterium sp.]|uniref:YqeG family HAD IIIA-type phosphatase n=1 Tax=Hydrogenoanaerobacterium sp. TaxID=2953763 RepID=UPI00289A0BAB|nr:YqeG family HAD IIIA-type phosphatase [Hydrogenoanaerobacterium sp.]
MSIFYPYYSTKRAYDLTPQLLHSMDIKALLLDVDNTLTTHGNPVPNENILEWLDIMKQSGIPLMILSNNTHDRVKPFADRLGLLFESSGAKPLPKGFQRCCERLGLPKSEVAIVGDQLFTDIAGANLFGIKSILVEPIELETGVLFFVKRVLERPFLRAYHRGRGAKGEQK